MVLRTTRHPLATVSTAKFSDRYLQAVRRVPRPFAVPSARPEQSIRGWNDLAGATSAHGTQERLAPGPRLILDASRICTRGKFCPRDPGRFPYRKAGR